MSRFKKTKGSATSARGEAKILAPILMAQDEFLVSPRALGAETTMTNQGVEAGIGCRNFEQDPRTMVVTCAACKLNLLHCTCCRQEGCPQTGIPG